MRNWETATRREFPALNLKTDKLPKECPTLKARDIIPDYPPVLPIAIWGNSGCTRRSKIFEQSPSWERTKERQEAN